VINAHEDCPTISSSEHLRGRCTRTLGYAIMNLHDWTARLAQCVHYELYSWRNHMEQDRLRALALNCHPWHSEALTLSFLTERESFDEGKYGKWAVADWRLYNFTSVPTANWPSAQLLMEEAHEFYQAAPKASAVEFRDQLIQACVEAMKSSLVSGALESYSLAPDFAIFVGHPDAPKKNHYA
jgi:hypothetical protein